MSGEDMYDAEPATFMAEADHLVLMMSADGPEKRWPVVGADRANRWRVLQQQANPKAYVIAFPLVRAGGVSWLS